ncbi:hypothetical protein D3C76_1625980 [compost metagenome]
MLEHLTQRHTKFPFLARYVAFPDVEAVVEPSGSRYNFCMHLLHMRGGRIAKSRNAQPVAQFLRSEQ